MPFRTPFATVGERFVENWSSSRISLHLPPPALVTPSNRQHDDITPAVKDMIQSNDLVQSMTTFYVLMLCWPLLLSPPAAPTLPSRSCSSSIAIESPSCRPSPSSCHCVVHHRQVASAPSIDVHHRCACNPLPSHSRHSSSSIPIESPSSSPSPSIAVESIAIEWLSRRPLPSIAIHHPSPSMSHPSASIAINQSIAVQPTRRPLPLSP